MPFFSVVIPTYNRCHLIGAAIESALAQTYRDFEIIVVDDGSTDGTADVVRRFDSQIRFVRQENMGEGPARNTGLAGAQGRYIAMLDSDDIWFPRTLETFRRVLESTGFPSAVFGSAVGFRGDIGGVAGAEGDVEFQQYPNFLRFYGGGAPGWWLPMNAAILRQAANEIGGFWTHRDPSPDIDFLMRLGTAPGCVVVSKPTTLAYRLHDGNISRNMPRVLRGVARLVDRERSGIYPGGEGQQRLRRMILGRLCRHQIRRAAREGEFMLAMRAYLNTLGWHVSQGRLKFVVGLPLEAIAVRAAGCVRR